jgi:hypothetical protein
MSLVEIRKVETLVRRLAVRELLSKEFLDDWAEEMANGDCHPLFGLCAIASFALWLMCPRELTPCMVYVYGEPHICLVENASGQVIDPTADQFPEPIDYSEAIPMPTYPGTNIYDWGHLSHNYQAGLVLQKRVYNDHYLGWVDHHYPANEDIVSYIVIPGTIDLDQIKVPEANTVSEIANLQMEGRVLRNNANPESPSSQ